MYPVVAKGLRRRLSLVAIFDVRHDLPDSIGHRMEPNRMVAGAPNRCPLALITKNPGGDTISVERRRDLPK